MLFQWCANIKQHWVNSPCYKSTLERHAGCRTEAFMLIEPPTHLLNLIFNTPFLPNSRGPT